MMLMWIGNLCTNTLVRSAEIQVSAQNFNKSIWIHFFKEWFLA